MRYQMNSKRSKLTWISDHIGPLLFLLFLISILIFMIVYAVRSEQKIAAVFDNPAFSGEIVDKFTREVRVFRHNISTWETRYFLHVVGVYFDGYEEVHVDRVMTVSERLFTLYCIGDTVPHVCRCYDIRNSKNAEFENP